MTEFTDSNFDLDLSDDEDEISCDIKLIGDTQPNTNNHDNQLEEVSDSVLDWSVSAISCATNLNAPDRFYTDFEPSSASASAWSSPKKENKARVVDRDDTAVDDRESKNKTPVTVLKYNNFAKRSSDVEETAVDIKQLVNNIQTLRSSIEAIHQKSLTPLSSPRRNAQFVRQHYNNATDSSKESEEQDNDGDDHATQIDGAHRPFTPPASSYSHYGKAFNSTPPVKDSGLVVPDVDRETSSGNAQPPTIALPTAASSVTGQEPNGNGGRIVNDTKPAGSDKLSQMRSVLKDLENARKRYDISRVPKRSLNFDDDLKNDKKSDNILEDENSPQASTSSNVPENKASNIVNVSSHEIAEAISDKKMLSNDDIKPLKQTEGLERTSLSTVDAINSNKTKALLDREFEEMNAFLDQVKNSSLSPISLSIFSPKSSSDRLSLLGRALPSPAVTDTAIKSTKTNEKCELESVISKLKADLGNETKSRMQLENIITELRDQCKSKNGQIASLEKANNEKLQLLLDVKQRWSEVSRQWEQDQNELKEKISESNSVITRLRDEGKKAKDQFSICQEELQKAVEIATDFKTKLEEEEKLNGDVLNELLSQKSTKAKQLQIEHSKVEELSTENEELKAKLEQLKNESDELANSQKNNNQEISNELLKSKKCIETLTKEKQNLIENVDNIEHERQAIESSLHTFYASQMESILTEKITTLQSNVRAWESNMAREKQEAVEFLQNQHVIQMESMTERHLKDMQKSRNDMKVLKASITASRKESDALREQLGLERTRRDSEQNNVLPAEVTQIVSPNQATTRYTQKLPGLECENKNKLSEDINGVDSLSVLHNDYYNIHLLQQDAIQNVYDRTERNHTRENNIWSGVLRSSMSYRTLNDHHVQNNLFGTSTNLRSKHHRSLNSSGNRLLVDGVGSSTSDDNQRRFYSRKSHSGAVAIEQEKYSSLNGSISQKLSTSARDNTMTTAEKKEIVRKFVERFFKDNPGAVLDPQLLFELNTVALRLIDKSPNPQNELESFFSIPADADSSTQSNSSIYELKKMLADRLDKSQQHNGTAIEQAKATLSIEGSSRDQEANSRDVHVHPTRKQNFGQSEPINTKISTSAERKLSKNYTNSSDS